MIDPADFLNAIIVPVLTKLRETDERLDSPAARNLMIGTALKESGLSALRQKGGGAGRGFFQVEEATLNDIYGRYLPDRRPDLLRPVNALMVPAFRLFDQLEGNPYFNCAIARLKFWMATPPLPMADDVDGLGKYWDDHYNCNPAVGTPEEWATLYRKYARKS